VYSDTITVTVNNELTGGKIGSDQEICYNNKPVAFTSVTNASGGRGTNTYEWQYSTNGTSWTAIGSSNSAAYTHNVNLTRTTKYRRKYSNTCGTVYSDTITVTVNVPLNPGTIVAENPVICHNTPVKIISTDPASGGKGTISYHWQYSELNGAVWGAWIDIDESNYKDYTPTAKLTVTTQYRRWATDDCGNKVSDAVTVTVRSASLYNYPDIRVRVCPDAGYDINLSKYIDTLDLPANAVTWSNIPINPSTGIITAGTFGSGQRIHTFTYTVNNVCLATPITRKIYLETLSNKIRPLKDTITICYVQAEAIQLNQLFGIDARGTWSYYSTSPGDINDYVKTSSTYPGATIMNGKAIYNNPLITKKEITVTYTPDNNSCLPAGKSYTIIIKLTAN
jgi:hypothetical protein